MHPKRRAAAVLSDSTPERLPRRHHRSGSRVNTSNASAGATGTVTVTRTLSPTTMFLPHVLGEAVELRRPELVDVVEPIAQLCEALLA